MSIELAELEKLLALMVRFKVEHLETEDAEIKMHPAAFNELAKPEPVEPGVRDICRCGHRLVVEHNEAGCLYGCALEVCAPPEEG